MTDQVVGKPASQPESPRSLWLLIGFTLVLAVLVVAVLVVFVGADLDAPTIGLAVACAAMIGALRGMWGIYAALARPTAELLVAEVEAEASEASSNLAELREEKRRALRAIKELEFDHAMGKLNDEDFKRIGDSYRLRAIEVMRKLDDDRGDLHPLLRQHLVAIGHPDRSEPAPRASAVDAPPTSEQAQEQRS